MGTAGSGSGSGAAAGTGSPIVPTYAKPSPSAYTGAAAGKVVGMGSVGAVVAAMGVVAMAL